MCRGTWNNANPLSPVKTFSTSVAGPSPWSLHSGREEGEPLALHFLPSTALLWVHPVPLLAFLVGNRHRLTIAQSWHGTKKREVTNVRKYLHLPLPLRYSKTLGCLGGSVDCASDLVSGHDLTVREFESRVRLCADSSEPGACFRFCVFLSPCPSPIHALSLSLW